MQRRVPVILTLALAFPFAALMATRQQQTAPPQMRAYFTAWIDDSPVRDLRLEEIELRSGKTPATILGMEFAAPESLAVAIVRDASGSRQKQMPHSEIEPAIQFVRNKDSLWSVALVSFDVEVYLEVPLTSEAAVLERQLRQRPNYRGSSALCDALLITAGVLRPATGKRAIAVVSDGIENASRVGLGDNQRALDVTASELRKSGIVLYFVLLQDQRGMKKGELRRALQAATDLAQKTGGLVIPASDPSQVAAAFAQVSEILRSEYTLLFTNAKNQLPEKLEVTTTRPDIKIRLSRWLQ